jgi:hypothetical protein
VNDSFWNTFAIKMGQEVNQMAGRALADRGLVGKIWGIRGLTNPEGGVAHFAQPVEMPRDP